MSPPPEAAAAPPAASAEPSARERVLVTATQMFTREGVHGTGINSVIARSGVAKDTLYKHFPSKQDLVLAVVRRRDQDWLGAMQQQVSVAPADPAGRLLAVFDVLDAQLDDPAYLGCLFLTTSTDYPDPEHQVRRASAEHKARVRAYLTELAEHAGVAEPVALGSGLMLLLDGAICARTTADDRTAGRRARQAAAILVTAATR